MHFHFKDPCQITSLLRATLEATHDAILVTDWHGRVLEFNANFLQLWKLSKQAVTTADWKQLVALTAPQVKDETTYCQRATAAAAAKGVDREEIALHDGRTLERTSAQHEIDNGLSVRVWTFRDITVAKRADELNSQQARYLLAAIVDSSDDAIISKDLTSTITSWNVGAEKIFGYTAAEALGKPVTMLFPPELVDEENVILSRIRSGERISHYETIRIRKNGTRIPVSITVSPVTDSSGRIIGASKIARDVSRQKELEREREALLESERAARSQAEQASCLKDEFLATVSHELRTPLNAILGWSQLLNASAGQESIAEGLEVIQRNARVQARLIEELLDMSRIISGKVRLDVQWVGLADVIEAAVESVRPAAHAKSIVLRKVLDPHAGPVSGDPTRLQQILWNLLSNAIKFTPKGGKIDVFLERVNSHLEITVRDNGVGIKPDFLPIVFERFRQVDASTTRTFGGLGLGLAIAKHLVELHGGNIRAKSAGEGQGATFIVELPLAPVREDTKREHPAALRATPLDYSQIDLSNIRVLLVDDETDARALVTRLLTECHATVQAASSADAALPLLAEFRPHVVVSDIGMPGKDGYEFIREVRALPSDQGGNVPAIALTAFARSEDRTRALMAGYQMHVTKPIEPQELLVTVLSLSRRAYKQLTT